MTTPIVVNGVYITGRLRAYVPRMPEPGIGNPGMTIKDLRRAMRMAVSTSRMPN